METNSFTFEFAYTNIESKIKINGLLFDSLTPICVCQWCQLSKLLYNAAAEVLANLNNADKRIKLIQKGDHEIKIVNFTDNTTTFLNLFMHYPKPLWGSIYKNRIHQPGQLE